MGLWQCAMTQKGKNMRTRTRISSIATEKVLAEINQSGYQSVVDAYAESMEVGGLTKNVCAKLPRDLVERMEHVSGQLDINKRQFLQAAIADAITEMERVIAEEGLYEIRGEREAEKEAAA